MIKSEGGYYRSLTITLLVASVLTIAPAVQSQYFNHAAIVPLNCCTFHAESWASMLTASTGR